MKKTKLEEWQVKRLERWELAHFPELIDTLPTRVKEILKKEEVSLMENCKQSRLFYGRSRTGKTVHVFREALRWHKTNFINRRTPRFLFKKVPLLLQEFRDLMHSPEEKKELLHICKQTKLLILDDIGACNMTDWATELLYMIIDFRYDDMRTTYYTSNFSLEELVQISDDDRIAGRIQNDCRDNIILFDNPPYI